MKTKLRPRFALLVPILLLCGFTCSCRDNKKELEALRKEAEASRKALEAIQRNQRVKNEGEARRNMESYFK
ncbi:MAG: hypothetical protein ABI600_18105 [Luteolibacter sp.]